MVKLSNKARVIFFLTVLLITATSILLVNLHIQSSKWTQDMTTKVVWQSNYQANFPTGTYYLESGSGNYPANNFIVTCVQGKFYSAPAEVEAGDRYPKEVLALNLAGNCTVDTSIHIWGPSVEVPMEHTPDDKTGSLYFSIGLGFFILMLTLAFLIA